ncbi:MAG: metallophosphoesterase family protein [Candidatus Dojkabacteria bacterium]
MKYLIFSDTHLTNRFNANTFDFLRSIIEKAERVIINGDFWDKHFVDYNQFVASKWKELFPLLKKKKAIYIVGNHDPADSIPKKVVFADKVVRDYQFKSGGKTIRVMHGDVFVIPKSKIYSWIPIPKPVAYGHEFLEFVKVNIFRGRVMADWSTNRIISRRAKQRFGENEIIIAGHSHRAEARPKDKYYNSGAIRFGFASYITVNNGKIDLIKTRY